MGGVTGLILLPGDIDDDKDANEDEDAREDEEA
jgi:hypothetical protein